MKNPTNTNAADAKEIQTELAREKGGGRAYWNAVKKSKDATASEACWRTLGTARDGPIVAASWISIELQTI